MLPDIPIYVVNLDRSPERLQSIAAQLARIGISFKRIAGVDGKTSDLERELFSGRASLPDVSSQSLTREEIGCHLSHLKAFDEILASGVSSAIILEDDLIISPRFQSAALALAAYFSGEPVVIKLEPWNKPRLAYMAHRCGDFDLIFTNHQLTQTGAYFITAEAIRLLRTPLSRIGRPYDDALYAAGGNGVGIFSLSPAIAQQTASFQSLIETGRRRLRDRDRRYGLTREIVRPIRQCAQFLSLLRVIKIKSGWQGLVKLRRHRPAGPGRPPQSMGDFTGVSSVSDVRTERVAR